mmetsp:Transcript_22495/g.73070  ORF Transcript_22495/g.73070 Transcript_22495/m.73070 type:complete len:643 (+) Transcript_22495:1232-3160(+)
MEALLRALWQNATQVLVHRLGEERCERTHRFAEREEHLEERAERPLPVLHAHLALQPLAIESHINVGELLDEAHETRADGVETVSLHLFADVAEQSLRRGVDPAIKNIGALERRHRLGVERASADGWKFDDVLAQEAVGVVPREEDIFEDGEDAVLLKLERLCAHHGRVDEVEAQRIRAVLLHHLVRVGVIFQALAHLFAVSCEDEAVAHEVLERRAVEERRGEHHQRVEPSTRLVEPFRDKVGGKVVLEELFVLERVVQLRVRHAPALEPAVEDVLDAFEHAKLGAALRRDGEVVDEVTVYIRDLGARQLLELLDGADDHLLLTVVRAPHRNGRAPVAVPAHRPVVRILEPVVEAVLLDVRRHPVRLFVVGNEAVLDGRDVHEEGGDRFVDERRVRPPAEGVRVHEHGSLDEAAFRLDGGDNLLVRSLDVEPFELLHRRAEAPVRVHGIGKLAAALHHAVRKAHTVVILAVRRRLVHHPRAAVVRDVRVTDDAERALLLQVGEVAEERLVARVLERCASHLLHHLVRRWCVLLLLPFVPGEEGQPRLGNDEKLARLRRLHLDVGELRVHAQRKVGRERPRSGGPRHERGAVRSADDGKLDHHGRVRHVAVVEPRLEVAQRGVACRAVRHHLESAVDEALVV